MHGQLFWSYIQEKQVGMVLGQTQYYCFDIVCTMHVDSM
jgi:hypothetical protein